MEIFKIEIPNTKARSYQFITIFLLLMNIVLFAFYLMGSDTIFKSIIATAGLVLNLVSIGFQFYQTRTKKFFQFNSVYAILVSAIFWLLLGNFMVALPLFLLGFLGFYANKKLIIEVSKTGIVYPSFPQKHFEWNTVSQTMVKDDILTIDLKNNQLLQFNLPPEELSGLEVQIFNTFCKSCVEAG